MLLKEVIDNYRTVYPSTDELTLAIFYATLATQYNSSNQPVFLSLVGETGSGKTTLLNTLRHPDFTHISDVKRAVFLSKAANIFDNQVKFIVIKDFAQVIAGQPRLAKSMHALFSELHDGSFATQVNTQVRRWEGKVTVLMATTEIIEGFDAKVATAGRRFLYLRIPKKNIATEHLAAATRLYQAEENAKKLASAAYSFIEYVKTIPQENLLSEKESEELAFLSSFVAFTRGLVIHKTGETTYAQEDPARLFQQIAQIVNVLKILGYENIKGVVAKILTDNIPPNRLALLKMMSHKKVIGRLIGESFLRTNNHLHVTNFLKQLVHLGILRKITYTQSSEDYYELTEAMQRYYDYYLNYLK